MDFDVTDAVTGGSPVSFLLRSTSTNSAFYSSREGANAPQLVLDTRPPAPPVAER